MTHNELIELRARLSRSKPVIAMSIGGHRTVAGILSTRGHEMQVKVWIANLCRWARYAAWHPLSAYIEDATPMELARVTTSKVHQLPLTG